MKERERENGEKEESLWCIRMTCVDGTGSAAGPYRDWPAVNGSFSYVGRG